MNPKTMSFSMAQMKNVWIAEQNTLKKQLICKDSFPWSIVVKKDKEIEEQIRISEETKQDEASSSKQDIPQEVLKFIGGVDLSFVKEDPTIACAALVVLDAETLDVVYEDFEVTTLTMPYIPGFLAFREAPALMQLINKMAVDAKDKFPQLIMVDGNGILHPRGFGLASHLGVLADVPTIGIGKTLFEVDGLDEWYIKKKARNMLVKGGDYMDMKGSSGKVWGSALRSTDDCFNPIFVSIGHRICLRTAVDVVRRCCRFRLPEPVRLADKKSREFLKKNGYTQA